MKFLAGVLLAIWSPFAGFADGSSWKLIRSPHFEVYSHGNEQSARAIALRLEQLRALFSIPGMVPFSVPPDGRRPLRAIQFASAAEYASFRPRASADAFFLGAEPVDYIVMPPVSDHLSQVVAHEYAHFVLRSAGLNPPPWFAEGFAELYSNVRITPGRSSFGGDLPARTRILQKHALIPLETLLTLPENASLRDTRDESELFYAESWELTHMLLISPAYAAAVPRLIHAFSCSVVNGATIAAIYGRPLPSISQALKTWIDTPKHAIVLPGVPHSSEALETSDSTEIQSRLVLAGLLLASGDLDRAQESYQAIAGDHSTDGAIASTLGSIAFRKHDFATARSEWKHALDLGVSDPVLCYQYALLLDEAGAPSAEIIDALHKAIELKPDFDDARFKLGLLESNDGNYQAGLDQLTAIRSVPRSRAFGYWLAIASAYLETGQRSAVRQAAQRALEYATSADQRDAASRLSYDAATDLTVRFMRDPNGNLQMVTARKPHGSDDWNPFIEPSDRILSFSGKILEVECAGRSIAGFRLRAGSQIVQVSLPDPSHVLIDGGKAEFMCGVGDDRQVEIQYAASSSNLATGTLRGLHFK